MQLRSKNDSVSPPHYEREFYGYESFEQKHLHKQQNYESAPKRVMGVILLREKLSSKSTLPRLTML